MLLVTGYRSKVELKAAKGESLIYEETSIFGPEYKANGTLTVANRPHLTGIGREFFATVEMINGKIGKVS